MRVLTAAKKSVGAVVLLISACGKIWVAERTSHKPYLAGCLESPGGTTEEGELCIVTAQREVQEETGLDIDAGRMTRRGFICVNGCIIFLYSALLKHHEKPRNAEPDKRKEWQLVSMESLLLEECAPSLGTLVSIMLDERRTAK